MELDRRAPAASAEAAAPAAPPNPAQVQPGLRHEVARYQIHYGVFGQVGEVTIALEPVAAQAPAAPALRLEGRGRGAVLGIGQMDKRIESEFDPQALGARRWTSVRSRGGKTVTDVAEQTNPGTVTMVRRRTGQADEPDTLTRPGPVFDPLAFLVRLRVAPPAAPQTFEMLDGHGLWRVTVAPPVRQPQPRPSLRLEGRAEPVFWDGRPDPERTARSFSLYLSDDEFRTPLRLVLPLALGAVRAELVSVTRPTAMSRAAGTPVG